jgi:hypothetical protein
MASSGTSTFNLDVEEIIEKAYDLIGRETVSAEDLKQARSSLDLLLIDMQNRGHPLAEVQQKTFTVTSASATYTLSAGVLDVLDVVVTRTSVDTPLERISMFEYHKIPTKTQKGLPSQFMIERQRDNTNISLFPTPENSTDVIDYWCLTRIEDTGAYSNTLDIAHRYLPALVLGLAYFISLSKRELVSAPDRAELLQLYSDSLETAMVEDRERVSFTVTPYPYNRRR